MKLFIIVCTLLFNVFVPLSVGAQSTEEKEAVVTRVLSENIIEVKDSNGNIFTAEVTSTKAQGYDFDLAPGDVVYVQKIIFEDNSSTVYFTDVKRSYGLWWIFMIFTIAVLAIGARAGFFALSGLFFTIAILFLWAFPRILDGADPVLTIIIASLVILGVNMHFSHGFSKSTFIAYLSTVVGLMFVLAFSYFFVELAHLTGLATEDSAMLFASAPDLIVPRGIILAGIILGAVGVLDDIAITQHETVTEIGKANLKLTKKELFVSAMRVGRHHIASVINTLVLAYAGAALPLFLIFMMSNSISIGRFINEEFVAEEIVRTLAGTVAIVLTVPIATWFALFTQKR